MIVINQSATKCNYTKGNISDVDDNAYYEAEGPFVFYCDPLYRRVLCNYISFCYCLISCTGSDRDPRRGQNYNPDGGQSTAGSES